jgi:hypothetical protein
MNDPTQIMQLLVVADCLKLLETLGKVSRNGYLHSLLLLHSFCLQLEDRFLDDAGTQGIHNVHHVLPVWHRIWHVLQNYFGIGLVSHIFPDLFGGKLKEFPG